MDAAAISSIVTGSVAIVAALVGAGVTGFFNHRNTKATLAAARQTSEDQWHRTRDRDHEVWLRDSRQEAYAAFHDESDRLTAKLTAWNPEGAVGFASIQQLSTLRSRIKLVGSPAVRVQARDVEAILLRGALIKQSLYELAEKPMKTGRDAADETQLVRELNVVRAKVLESLIDFVLAVREDLGTATEQDRQLNAAMQTEGIADGDLTAGRYDAPVG